MRAIILSILLSVTYALFAEIEFVSLQWNNIQCKEDCASKMEYELRRVKEIADISVSQSNGTATMQWKAKKPFSFQAIDSAVKKVGLHVDVLKVRVRGTVTENNHKFYINSIGDNSKFNLLGAASDNPEKNRYVIQKSRYNRPLSKGQEEQLREAMKKSLPVTIEGPIYQPYQFPPLDLIVQSIKVSNPKDLEKK